MPITEITRPGTETQTITPLDEALLQPKYDFNYYTFPADLSSDQVGHYMVINVNVPTNMAGNPAGNYTNLFTPVEPTMRSKVDQLRGITPGLLPVQFPGFPNPLSSTPSGPPTSAAAVIPRATRRIVQSIALHMPTPLVFSQQNEYQEISLTALGGDIVSRGVTAATAAAAGIGSGKAGGGIAGMGAAALTSAVGGFVGDLAKFMQMPINPAVEVLFANTSLRSFTFEVLMAPRNEGESESIRNIITAMKFHGAPELSYGGLIWIPPAEFDITFFNKGVENPNIQRINTCVLERFEVDYAPTGIYSTFRNGHPVAVRMSMAFRELEAIHKQRVLQGF